MLNTIIAILGIPALLYGIIKILAKTFFLLHYSLEEKQILKGAQESDGYIHVNKASIFGKWVQVGKTEFLDNENRAFQEKYLSALEKLYIKGLVRMENLECYRLTSPGYDVAKTIRLKTTMEVERPANETEHANE